MINLLPPKTKQGYDYARRNVRLLHWVIALVLACIGLLAIGTTGLIYMQQRADSYNKQVSRKQSTLETQKLAQTQTKAKDISNNLKLSVKVLSKEVLFSKLLKQLGTITPGNVSLSTLTISQTTGALDIIAQTADYAAATQLQVNLTDPANKIFSTADVVSFTCTSKPTVKSAYPCTANIRALFSKDNPYLFINSGKDS